MTDPDEKTSFEKTKEKKAIYEKEGKGQVFDMYRFFSRWDVIAAIAVVLLLVIYVVLSRMHGTAI